MRSATSKRSSGVSPRPVSKPLNTRSLRHDQDTFVALCSCWGGLPAWVQALIDATSPTFHRQLGRCARRGLPSSMGLGGGGNLKAIRKYNLGMC
ncbi:hypothetical protein CCICO_05275 [Corynebacterium ciconiae DSM 44920]|nr:hypothetical protein CCICO_05275 [Corynebacterium ciconiae DSM 44920]